MPNEISNIHIKQVNVDGIDFAVSALHFIANSSLNTPESWLDYINETMAEKARIQIIIPPNNVLPTPSSDTAGKFYLISDGSVSGAYTEYVTLQDSHGDYFWESIGTTSVDLSEYALKEDVNAAFDSMYAKNTTDATGSSGATTVNTEAGGAQTAIGHATGITQNIYSVSEPSITIYGSTFTFTGNAVSIPEGTVTIGGHAEDVHPIRPSGSIGGTTNISGHTHSVQYTTATVVNSATIDGMASAVDAVSEVCSNVAVGISNSTDDALYALSVSSDGTLYFNATPVITDTSLSKTPAVTNFIVTTSAVVSSIDVGTLSAMKSATLLNANEHTVQGSEFTFTGTETTIGHNQSEGSYARDLSVVNPTYTVSGSITGTQTIAEHAHYIEIQSLTATDIPVSVDVPNHTHSVTFDGHTHSMSHTHNISFPTLT